MARSGNLGDWGSQRRNWVLSLPTWSCSIKPQHCFLHSFCHWLKDRYTNDTTTADHPWLKCGIVEKNRFDRKVLLYVIEWFGKAHSEDAEITGCMAARLHIEGSLRVNFITLWKGKEIIFKWRLQHDKVSSNERKIHIAIKQLNFQTQESILKVSKKQLYYDYIPVVKCTIWKTKSVEMNFTLTCVDIHTGMLHHFDIYCSFQNVFALFFCQ